mmetsp:Transcript_41189/g.80794  ORF Transcript_41189/g.80794 Transcript_41189/m.80794 type:complete len:1046 (-) Transcript_41189:201-3338(-)|eukprot:CAMPEP_0175130970 /NCGR_PEP_ID=MMETSP0087-20121206/6284_1 /TAXON_ID=136419 /ORGANISM="Unknown Unknown, Strain D1" /LENGTH=1045 /DNA_ID=CAMNT_0016413211 /DNA_START=24 /DNA_END=3161 /DNA_ORIENTATION=-
MAEDASPTPAEEEQEERTAAEEDLDQNNLEAEDEAAESSAGESESRAETAGSFSTGISGSRVDTASTGFTKSRATTSGTMGTKTPFAVTATGGIDMILEDMEEDDVEEPAPLQYGESLKYFPKQVVATQKQANDKPQLNLLLDNQVYHRVGKTNVLQIEPPIVFFKGYKLNKPQTQKFRVLNISNYVQRIHVLPPSTPFFSINFNKKGSLAPGMAEVVTITFKPDSHRHYTDNVKIHCPGDNLTVPIQAYPVMTNKMFPSRIDMGSCQMGESVTQNIKLECEYPVEYEYEVVAINTNPDYHITPMSGVVPANGARELKITYRPTRLITSQLKIKILVSQFGFEPFSCTIVGSAFTTAVSSLSLQQLLYDKTNHPRPHEKAPHATPYTSHILHTQNEVTASSRAQTAGGKSCASTARTVISGHKFDYSDWPNTDVEFVGKTQKEKEAVFFSNFNEYEQYETTLEINPTKARSGQCTMTDATQLALEAAREEETQACIAEVQDIERNRSSHDHQNVRVARMRDEELNRRKQHMETPSFNVHGNDTWKMRQRVLDLFRRSVSKLLVRKRVAFRLAKLSKTLVSKGGQPPDEEFFPPEQFSFSVGHVSPASWLPVEETGTIGNQHAPVAINSDFPQFDVTPHLHLKEPFEYQLLSYQAHKPEPAPHFLHLDRAPLVRVGELGEQAFRQGIGDTPDFLQQPDIPLPNLPEVEIEISAEGVDAKKSGKATPAPEEVLNPEAPPPLRPGDPLPPLQLVPFPQNLALPNFLMEPFPSIPKETIRTDPAIQILAPKLEGDESTPEFWLRKTFVESAYVSRAHLSEECGTESIQLIEPPLTLSDVWVEQVDNQLEFDFEQYGLNPDLGILSALDQTDGYNLTEAEFDEQEADLTFSAPAPTIELSRTLFSQDIELPEVSEEDPKAKGKGGTKKNSRPGTAKAGKPPRPAPTAMTRDSAKARVEEKASEARTNDMAVLITQITKLNQTLISVEKEEEDEAASKAPKGGKGDAPAVDELPVETILKNKAVESMWFHLPSLITVPPAPPQNQGLPAEE